MRPILRQQLEAFGGQVAREWKFILATFSASGIGYLGSSAAPVIVQALIDSGLSHQRAGDLGTIELMTLTWTAMLVTPYVPRVSHRKLALGGALMAALGVAISALSESYLQMIIGRLITGAGSGLAIAGANAAIAAREEAERIFAIIWTMGGAITAALTINLPKVVEGGNYRLGFGVLLLLCLAATPFIFWVPPRPAKFGSQTAVPTAVAGAEAPGPLGAVRRALSAGRFGPFGLLGLLVLSGVFFYSLAEQALWQFSYDIAVDHGIPYDSVRYLLGVTTFAGLTGGAIAAWLGLRLGRIFPVVAGSLLSLAGRWVYIAATSSEALFVGSLLWGIGFYFVSPYQIGLAAALDRRGRIVVAATGLTNLGYALGPTLGGRIRQYQLDHGLDHSILVAVIAGATFLSLVALLPVAMRLSRMAQAKPAQQPAPVL